MKVTKGKFVTEYEYSIEFTDRMGNGFSFPSDENGNLKPMAECAKKNYEWCNEHKQEFEIVGLHKRKIEYRELDTGICDNCGSIIELRNEYMGACECENCGQWYNLFGQPLLPPSEWLEDC